MDPKMLTADRCSADKSYLQDELILTGSDHSGLIPKEMKNFEAGNGEFDSTNHSSHHKAAAVNGNGAVSGTPGNGDRDLACDDINEVPECGVWGFKPRLLQPCANIAVFTGVYSLSALVTSTLSTYVNSQVTTLERQFGFSSSQTGLIMAANDIGFLSCILIFSYLALRVHIPRTLSILCVLFGASGLICSMPHFLFGAADVTGDIKNDTMSSSAKTVTSFGQLCLLDGNRSATDCEETEQSDETAGAISGRAHSQAALVLIVIGMMLQGICKSPRWPYVIFYVDGNIGDKTKTGFYLGVVVALAIFGPVFAFILGGVFTKMYVTLEPTTLTPTHPRWIGAWWLGFLVFGVMSMMIGVPLVWFPRWMKGKAPEVEKPTDKHHGSTHEHHDKMKQALQQVKELPATMWRLSSNPIYISLLLSGCFILFSVAGLQAFMPKYIENQFSLPAWRANLVIAVTSMITASFGTFVGGYLTRRFKMTPMESLKFTIVLQFFAVATAASGFFIKCPQPAIYNMPGGQGPTSSNASCFSSCLCDDNDYLPVCGSDGLTYFSPCHAGCVKAEDQNTYTNCTCIPGGQAVAGACDYGCDMLYVFAVLQAVSALFSCMCIMPKMVTNIRCVTPRDKAFAMGCSSFMSSLLGWLLGPVIFGNMIDGVCSFWERTCDGRGTCLLYDNDVFRVRLFSYVVVARAGGFLCILVAYISARVTGRLDGTTSTHGAGEVDKKGFGMMD